MARPGSSPVPWPWLCILLLAACTGVSLFARSSQQDAALRVDEALEAAQEYFLAHPYLEPGPTLRVRIGADAVARSRAGFESRRFATGGVSIPDREVRRQQKSLDARVEGALASASDLAARRVSAVPADGPSAAWLAYTLLHPSGWLLIGNGLLLLLLGVYLERSLGRVAFAVTAVVCALAGAAAWSAFGAEQGAWGLVGTTPMLAGLLAAFALRHARHASEPFYLAGALLGGLWIVLPPYAGARWSFESVQLVTAVAAPPAAGLYWACLAAAGSGAAAAGLAWLTGLAAERGPGCREGRHPDLRRAERARRAGRPREALELLEGFLRSEPDAHEAAIAIWEIERELGHVAEAAAARVRVIGIEVKRKLSSEAIGHWLELAADAIPEKADPMLLIHMSVLLREAGYRAEAADALRCALERTDDRAAHVVAARIARAARGLDPEITEAAAWRALGSIELGLRERQALEGLLGEVLSVGGRRQRQATASRPRPAALREPIAIETQTPPRSLDAVTAVPLELGDAGLEIQTDAGAKKLVRYERIEAIAVAAVRGLSAKPVILVDLVLNWRTPAHETLRVIRLRGDRFDPRQLTHSQNAQASAGDALRTLVGSLLDRSHATPLPDAAAAAGRPFVSYDEPAVYERAVLRVG